MNKKEKAMREGYKTPSLPRKIKQFVKLKKYIAFAVRVYRREYEKECKYAGNPDDEIVRAYTKGALDAYETMARNLKDE